MRLYWPKRRGTIGGSCLHWQTVGAADLAGHEVGVAEHADAVARGLAADRALGDSGALASDHIADLAVVAAAGARRLSHTHGVKAGPALAAVGVAGAAVIDADGQGIARADGHLAAALARVFAVGVVLARVFAVEEVGPAGVQVEAAAGAGAAVGVGLAAGGCALALLEDLVALAGVVVGKGAGHRRRPPVGDGVEDVAAVAALGMQHADDHEGEREAAAAERESEGGATASGPAGSGGARHP
jgi:hypothetical protein